MNFLLTTLTFSLNTLWSFAYYLPLTILGLIGLCLLVVLHEFGHFIFAKIFNVYIPSFSIGFGPRLIQKKIGDTVFAISAIPLGGYVEIAGAPEIGQGEQAHAQSKDSRSFNQKSYWQKMMIMLGGILFNFIFTYLALTLLFYTGAPCIGSWCKKFDPVIATVVKDSPAEKAGIISGDKIIAVDSTPVKNIKHLTELLTPYIDKTAKLKILRDNKEQEIEIKVAEQTAGGKKIPRIGAYWYVEPKSIKQAFVASWHATCQMVKAMFKALKGLTKSREEIGGPLILITQLTQSVGMGWKIFIFMLAFISINLAVLNIIPLPIFDGGQALFYTIEAITGKPLSEEVRHKIHYYTWIAVIAFLIYITYKDVLKINKLFNNKTEQTAQK